MPKYKRRQPDSAWITSAPRVKSPTTTSAPVARKVWARSSSRLTSARTGKPRRRSNSTTVRPTAPTLPAAPVTKIGVLLSDSIFRFPAAAITNPASEKTVTKAGATERIDSASRIRSADLRAGIFFRRQEEGLYAIELLICGEVSCLRFPTQRSKRLPAASTPVRQPHRRQATRRIERMRRDSQGRDRRPVRPAGGRPHHPA